MTAFESRLGLCAVILAFAAIHASAADFRPPAVPLVACDPYFSVWSAANTLTDADTTHWTGKLHRIASLAKIDGKVYRVIGTAPEGAPAMEQTGLSVLPTRTIYTLKGGGIALTLTFTTPALPDGLEFLARPVTYLTYSARSEDGHEHAVELYFDASGELAVNTPGENVTGELLEQDGLRIAKIGSVDQPVLMKKGDDLRIDWGYFYLAVPENSGAEAALAPRANSQSGFSAGAASKVTPIFPAPGGDIVGAVRFDLGQVGAKPVERWLMLAYDDLYSIQYMKENLRPYWRRNGWEAADLLRASASEYAWLAARCANFDAELMAGLERAGGKDYAQLAALAYRQCFAAGKFVADANGQPLQFCKENHSNGCIATSDVFYPMAPQFLLFGPTLAKSFIVPFMEYAASERWKFPFAPHDLGQYPHANGQRYGGGETSENGQMPVEESGNLLILMGAIAKMEGHAGFASQYWPQLSQWAAYLKSKGFDPENQLCTDDFAGHMAHNVNLSVKAICGIGAYAQLCALRGDTAQAKEYGALAKQFAERWVREADDGGHFRLAFDQPGTWSQKYNLVWDNILGLNLFPAAVKEKEMTYYKEIQNAYGLPLDNRSTYTKLDWILWTATLTEKQADFEALVKPVMKFLDETPDRTPMSDWYFTDTGKRRGFDARPVVGGVFLRMLYEQDVWAKYAARDTLHAAGWAPMPAEPKRVALLATSENEPASWRYTATTPAGDWFAVDYGVNAWRRGPAGFGTQGTPNTAVRTEWKSGDIWLRRTFGLKPPLPARAALRIHHDEDAQVYLNGDLVWKGKGYTTQYESVEFDAAALRPGKNVIAIHCKQTDGGQYIDAGIDALIPEEK